VVALLQVDLLLAGQRAVVEVEKIGRQHLGGTGQAGHQQGQQGQAAQAARHNGRQGHREQSAVAIHRAGR
jgi:hypothetical protein